MEKFKYFLLGVIVAGVINIASSYLMYRGISHEISSTLEEYKEINRVDSVIEHYYHDNTILREKNDSINVKIIDISTEYEKMVDSIMLFNVRDDYNFFSNYTNRYRNSHNSDSTQNSESDIR